MVVAVAQAVTTAQQDLEQQHKVLMEAEDIGLGEVQEAELVELVELVAELVELELHLL